MACVGDREIWHFGYDMDFEIRLRFGAGLLIAVVLGGRVFKAQFSYLEIGDIYTLGPILL